MDECILSKPRIQESVDQCILYKPRKLVPTNLSTFTVYIFRFQMVEPKMG